jgi:hypothetical protein
MQSGISQEKRDAPLVFLSRHCLRINIANSIYEEPRVSVRRGGCTLHCAEISNFAVESRNADAHRGRKSVAFASKDARLKVPQFAQKREQLVAWAGLMKNSFGFPTRHVNKRIEAPPTAVRPPVRAKLTKGVLIIRSAGSNLNPWVREAQTRFASIQDFRHKR